jgi:small-conductance mechanosensitive channel
VDADLLKRVIVALAIMAAALVAARVVDGAVVRRLEFTPEGLTRYRVLRRTIMVGIVFVGVVGALMVFPIVQAAASAVLASSAILALVIGYAAQPTLANFIAGVFIAFQQPVRIGDRIDAAGASGTVEDVGLTYTRVRAADGARYFLPNAKLASDTIRNATLASREHLVRASVSVPRTVDASWVQTMLADEARRAPGTLSEKQPMTRITRIDADSVEITVDAWARTAVQAAAAGDALRAAAWRRLRERDAA